MTLSRFVIVIAPKKTFLDITDVTFGIFQCFIYLTQILTPYPAAPMAQTERELFFLTTAPLHELCKKYSEDIRGLLKSVIRSLLQKFIDTEKYFQSKTFEKNAKDILLKVGDLNQTLDMIISHSNLENKTKLIAQILTLISKKDAEMIAELEGQFTFFTN